MIGAAKGLGRGVRKGLVGAAGAATLLSGHAGSQPLYAGVVQQGQYC